MDAWKPLAPVSLSSSAKYSRAPEPSASSSYHRPPPLRNAGASTSEHYDPESSVDSARKSSDVRRSSVRAYTQPPSDPFPPVGKFPRSVAVRTLSFLSLSDQRSCALAARAFAGAVADESNWRRRLDALDWCHVDGLQVHFDERDAGIAEGERAMGRRRKAKARVTPSSAVHEEAVSSPKHGQARPSADTIAPSHESKSAGEIIDDDFGDFAGPSSSAPKDDLFADVPFDRQQPSGGSLASGLASVAIGGGKPHSISSAGPSKFTPLVPTKAGPIASKGAADASKVQAGNAIFSYSAEARLPRCDASPSFRVLRSYAKALRPFVKSLADTSSPANSSLLFTCDLGLAAQAALLSNLLRYLSTSVGGFKQSKQRARRNSLHTTFDEEDTLSYRGQEAANHLLQTLLSSFHGTSARRSDAIRAASHGADTTRAIRRAEEDMRSHANSVWELGNARLALALSEHEGVTSDYEDEFGRMKAARQFLDQLDVFGEALRTHSPLDNIVARQSGTVLDFTAMDRFIADLSDIVRTDGAVIARVFPPEQDILIAYADQVATQVVGKYIASLLNHAASMSKHTYLRSCAATFAQAWNLVDVLMSIEPRQEEVVTQHRCEDVIFRMWDEHITDYLNAENEWVREEMQKVTEKWETDLKNDSTNANAAFLNSQNPAAVKRSVLTGFKDVLLLPVTVVPRAVGSVGGAVIRTAGTGLSTLNPLRWQSGVASSGKTSTGPAEKPPRSPGIPTPSTPKSGKGNFMDEKGYIDFSNGGIGGPESDDEDDDYDSPNEDVNRDEWNEEVAAWSAVASVKPDPGKAAHKRPKFPSTSNTNASQLPPRSATPTTLMSGTTGSTRASTPLPDASKASLSQMQTLLSLDTALQVIHVNRDCLKRIETFKKYPSPTGERIRLSIQEVSLLLFKALGEGHVSPGFKEATKRIEEYDPKEAGADVAQGEKGEQQVEPLVHFFELTHVGDTIAQMVQVYFDEEMGQHIDKNDFMNPVVKGKKRFEASLDEAVARGLNAGVDILLGQCEHILATKQSPKDFNPGKGMLSDLSPTLACREVVECLRVHCRMLVGSTDKNVLEVFYQEVGIRLHGLICKHLKRQVVSLDGGFRLIADLNDYHAFITTLRQPMLTADFDALKMLGNLYIIDNPRELAKLARDASSFGGTLSPEDLYEFLQARADFKYIEKAVDKEMYGFKVSEDCIVA